MKPLFKRAALCVALLGALYFSLFDTTPQGRECERSTSPNGAYVAERCVLRWIPSFESKYVGRLFDAKSGKKLAQHTFATPVPELRWSPGMDYSRNDDGVLMHLPPSVSFSRGGDDDSDIALPPSTWDRLLAARPHL
jgi:hypothetical protein